MQTSRRRFILHLAAGSSALAATRAMAQAKLDEKDAAAVALGYVTDTTRADAKKYPKHEASQRCGTCQLFQGKPGAADGPCPLFPNKTVSANGWCASWVKKA
ncbi:MAG TPA: high-potential iron-sulfur protein [Rubrivivax sp.]|nr:high-potential iron-sulfur protein [Rubrivivax sp.]